MASRKMGKGRMKGDRRRRRSDEATLPFETQDDQAQNVQLLPGIPNEVTLEQITTRLRWRTVLILSSVSRAWKQAIQSRQLYDARVRSDSTEAFAVINYSDTGNRFAHALYSFRDKACYQLPRIPYLDGRIPWSCRCIALDGKIYVLGGLKPGTHSLGSERVFVLDLAGQCKWKQCASMLQSRQKFGCGVVDGKIYVFGGTSLDAPVCGSEVYDPSLNAWSATKPMPSWRFNHEVATMGEELVVYGGKVYKPRHTYQTRNRGFGDQESSYTQPSMAFVEAYDPGKDTWRLLSRNPWNDADGTIFIAQGRFHSMPERDIYVFDIEKESRKCLHSSSFAAIVPHVDQIYGVLAVDDVLLAAVGWGSGWRNSTSYGRTLIRSRGLGRENEELVWEKAASSLPLGYSLGYYLPTPCLPIMCPLRL